MKTYFRGSLLLIVAVATVVGNSRSTLADKFDVALWVDRLIKETETVIDEGDMPAAELPLYANDAIQLLGYYGKDTDALRFEKKSRIYQKDKPDDSKLMDLAVGLSGGDFFEKAISIADQIESDDSREYCLSFIAHEQARNGHFETALSTLPRLQSPERIRFTKIYVGNAYVRAGRIDDAKRLANGSDILATIEETINLQPPSLDAPNYVESMVRIRSYRPSPLRTL